MYFNYYSIFSVTLWNEFASILRLYPTMLVCKSSTVRSLLRESTDLIYPHKKEFSDIKLYLLRDQGLVNIFQFFLKLSHQENFPFNKSMFIPDI